MVIRPSALCQSVSSTLSTCALAIDDRSGIGVTRYKLQHLYAEKLGGYAFESSALAIGEDRVMATSQDGTVIVELIGPASNLTKAAIFFTLPRDRTPMQLLNVTGAIAGFMTHVAPDWAGGNDFVMEAINSLADGHDDSISTGFGGILFEVSVVREMGFFWISASPQQ